jgi:hypothetical protein
MQILIFEKCRYKDPRSPGIKDGGVQLTRMMESRYHGWLNSGTKDSKVQVPAMLNSRYQRAEVRAKKWKTPVFQNSVTDCLSILIQISGLMLKTLGLA